MLYPGVRAGEDSQPDAKNTIHLKADRFTGSLEKSETQGTERERHEWLGYKRTTTSRPFLGPDHADSEPHSLDRSHGADVQGYLFTKSQEHVSVDTILTLKIPTPL